MSSADLMNALLAGSSGEPALPPDRPASGPRQADQPLVVRSIFLSDIHLGTRACQAERLLDFLRNYESDYLFLVGDILDFWAMARGVYWSSAQNTVIQKILKKARHGAQVVYIPGNHDEVAREHVGVSFGNIQVVQHHLHTAADGKRYLLLHGDEFDQITRYHRWLAILGDRAYALAVRVNMLLSLVRRTLRIPGYWSLAGYAKRRVKKALTFIYDFEESVVRHARERGVDGVICGHIHAAVIRDVDGIAYVNCGDWVDSCTAIVEHMDGRLELVHGTRLLNIGDSYERQQRKSATEVIARPDQIAA
jgi:UDP-2,3-diacylglucosamine pyrophosphatase LpxH